MRLKVLNMELEVVAGSGRIFKCLSVCDGRRDVCCSTDLQGRLTVGIDEETGDVYPRDLKDAQQLLAMEKKVKLLFAKAGIKRKSK